MPNDKDFAMVIGVNDYSSLTPLEGPIADAEAFQAWLLSPEGGDLPPANCRLIRSSQPDFRPVQIDIDEAIADIITRDDGSFRRFYFFFAGHGIGIDWKANGLCMPKWSELFRNLALSSEGYLDFLVKTSIFPEVYFFLDCCRQREINARPLHPSLDWIRPRGGGITGVVVYAAPFENPAGEARTGGDNTPVRGFFSRALVEGLGGAAADNDGNISVTDLINFTRRRTSELAAQKGKVQLVNTQLTDGGRDPGLLLLKTGTGRVNIDLQVHFTFAGTMKLSGPDFSVLLERLVTTGETWPAQPLRKGLYIIRHEESGKEGFIKIDGTANPMIYEFS